MNNLNYEDYMNDLQVKSIINSLKNKIESVSLHSKQNINKDNNKENNKIEKPKEKIEKPNVENNNKQDWDKSVYGDKKIDFEKKIAKFIADEILKSSKVR